VPPKLYVPKTPDDCQGIQSFVLTKPTYDELMYVETDEALKKIAIVFKESTSELPPLDTMQVLPIISAIDIAYVCNLDGEPHDHDDFKIPIKEFSLQVTTIKKVSEKAFERLRDLEKINLSANQLTTLPENLFKQNQKLLLVELSNNNLEYLQPNIFKFNSLIKHIRMERNKLQSLPENLFDNLNKLEEIVLSSNRLTTLPANLFKNNINVLYIILKNNKIEKLSPDTFKSQMKIKYLSIWLNGNVCINKTITLDNFEDLKPCYINFYL
jgi:Leucine-rich repeat (LRR) protein